MKIKMNTPFLRGFVSTILFLLINSAFAEDIEILADETPATKPNILMVLDHSGSMSMSVSGSTQTRLDALRTAFNTIMSDPGFSNVKVGLMGFSNGKGTPYPHGVSFPVTDIDDESAPIMLSNIIPYRPRNSSMVGYFTLADDVLPDPLTGERVREFLPRILTGWNAWGSTPLVDAYYEAALYFRGDKPKWGLATPELNHAAHPSTYRGSSEGTITQVLTGNTLTCDTPDCGINCLTETKQALCKNGDVVCGLATNCSTNTETWTTGCSLSTEAECMASDPRFTSCTSSGLFSCSDSCLSGVYHPETGECIPDALASFSIKTFAANMCLEVHHNEVTQEWCDGSTRQAFYTTEARTGYVHIHQSDTDCLGVTSTFSSNIVVSPCTNLTSGNQVFRVIYGKIVSDLTGRCFDVLANSTLAGQPIIQYACGAGANQVFSMSNEATSCSTSINMMCQYPQEVTYCDHQKYRCDETREEVSLNMFDIVYNSPIADACDSNAIILLSDGEPYVPDRTQYAQTMVDVKALTGSATDCVGTSDGRCGVELARFLSTQDQSASVDGDNLIKTYTIGFDVRAGSAAETFLKGVAKAGDGNYFPASNAAGLAAVFKNIISDVSKTARSYVAPVYTVDQASLMSHSRDVYIPLFENSAAPGWSGNLKKFKLNSSGQITDKTGKVAVNSDGNLDPEAVDFWGTMTVTSGTDKPNPVTSGGVANLLVPANRTLLTDNGSALISLDATSASKTAMSGRYMNAISSAQHTAMLQFIKGYNKDGTARHHIGDILHSKPTVISYSDKDVIFFGTNEGFLHAINAKDAGTSGGGQELFAFMPSELLPNIPGLYENDPLTGDIKRIYGVDGEMTAWINDKNKNGKLEADQGETAYLYFGLRRGGNAYYALDITNPSSPKLLWRISNSTTGFEQLAQSWSKPATAKLRYKAGGAAKYEHVLVFGGGYDATVYDKENLNARGSGNVKGNGVYIVNAKTGALIWSHTGGDLQDSVASSIRTLDLDRNGSIDRLYFGDLGGNVWRADLNIDDIDNDASLNDVSKDARLYRLANLGTNAGKGKRMFFNEPDVSLFKHKGQLVIVLAIGSGYRSHPKNITTQDQFYVLYDENVINTPETPPQAFTHNHLISASGLAGRDFLPDYKGWYLDLTNNIGEKSLSSPLIFLNKVMFTTYSLSSAPAKKGRFDNNCTVQSNHLNHAYVLDLMTASATVDLDGDGVISGNDSFSTIAGGEIPDSPKLVFNQPADCTKKGCDQYVDVRIGKMQTPLINKDTVNGKVNLGDFLPKMYWINPN